MPIATFWDVAAEHLISFTGGLLIGFILTNRYKISKRNGEQ